MHMSMNMCVYIYIYIYIYIHINVYRLQKCVALEHGAARRTACGTFEAHIDRVGERG